MRKPISLVRSVTDTSMMFMMPMPPTISEMAAVAPSSRLKMFCVSVRVRMNSAMLRTWKSSGVPRRTWRRERSRVSISLCASLISSAEATSTMMRLRLSGTVFSAPNRRRRAVETGTTAVSSWSVPKPDWPFGASSPITVKGTFMTRTCWPMTGPSANSSRAVVAPRMITLAADLISASVKLRPSVSAQSRTSRKSSPTPSIDVVQLVLPNTIGAEPLTMPVAAATPGILSRITARSDSDSASAVPSPARRPPEV